jgi:uncharacterized OsmC-like protein
VGSDFAVAAAAGSLRSSVRADAVFPHQWTDEGVAVEVAFTGAHLLHLAAAACVLNDLYREAAHAGVELNGVRVTAEGDFDRESWRSTGIRYGVQVDSDSSEGVVNELIGIVDHVAEIPRALREGADVRRIEIE